MGILVGLVKPSSPEEEVSLLPFIAGHSFAMALLC